MTLIPALERELIAAAQRAQQRVRQDAGAASPDARLNLITRARRFLRLHRRLAIFVVALVVSGCAAVAATTLSGSSERLALGRVNCYYGTYLSKPWDKNHDVLNIGATLVNGESPQAWCRQDFRQYSAASLRSMGLTPERDPKLIACRKDSTTIAVLIASGKPDQCRRLGLTPLPVTYAAASSTVRSLGAQLSRLYLSRNCWSARPFARAVRTVLAKHGLGSWHVFMPSAPRGSGGYRTPAGTSGNCAVFIYPNPYVGNPYQSLDGVTKSFRFGLGMSHSNYELWIRLLNKLTAETWRNCYKPWAARRLVDSAFAGTGLQVRLAITRPINAGFNFATSPQLPRVVRQIDAVRERHYKLGCVIQPDIWIASNDRFADVWLTVRHGRWIKFGTYPPPNSYFH